MLNDVTTHRQPSTRNILRIEIFHERNSQRDFALVFLPPSCAIRIIVVACPSLVLFSLP